MHAGETEKQALQETEDMEEAGQEQEPPRGESIFARVLSIVLSLTMLLLALGGYLYLKRELQAEQQRKGSHLSYEEAVALLHPESVNNLEKRLAEGQVGFFLYIGQEHDADCLRFAQLLAANIPPGVSVYYLDTEPTETNREVPSFLKNLHVTTLPAFGYFYSSTYFTSLPTQDCTAAILIDFFDRMTRSSRLQLQIVSMSLPLHA